MANLSGVNIQRGKVGANRSGNSDSISGIIITTPAVVNLQFDVPVKVYNMNDVEDLGITQTFDDNQNVNVYEHLKEFFRLAGSGTELHLIIEEQSKSMSDLLDQPAKKLILASGGSVQQVGVAVNLIDGATVTSVNGVPEDVLDAVSAAKTLEEWSEENFMPVTVFLEGHHYSGQASSAQDLRAIQDLSAEGVAGIVIGQDFDRVKNKTGNAQNYAFLGTVLGITAKSQVQQNIGENESNNLTAPGILVTPALSNHETIQDQFSDLQTLEDKGYIFGLTYTGMAGVRLNNDPVCAPVVLDQDNSINEHSVAYGRVGKKARRLLRSAYLPKVKTNWLVNQKTGKLSPATIVALEAIGNTVLADMQGRGEITAGDTQVDPDSDLVVTKLLKVGYRIVPRGSIGEITGFINLKTQL